MKDPTIFINGEDVPLEKALKIMTDEWVDDGNYCAQTVIDLRNALDFYIGLHSCDFKMYKKHTAQIKDLKKQIKDLKKEFATERLNKFLTKYN